MIDLHTHSNYSDGKYRPCDIVRMAKNKNLTAIALTDHDTVAGLEEAIDAGKLYHIKVIPGIELSTCGFDDGGPEYRSIHILGYFNAEKQNWNNKFILDAVNFAQEQGNKRTKAVIRRLYDQGIKISFEEVKKNAKGQIARMHIAQVMVKHKYASNVEDAVHEYLSNGKYANLRKERPIDSIEAVELLKNSLAVPALAHPHYITKQRKAIVRELAKCGLKGIEVYVSTATLYEKLFFKKLSKIYSLVALGGSDFHFSPEKLGKTGVPEESLIQLEKLIFQSID